MSTDSGETRRTILRAARELLEQRGAAKVRMADVARRAGVSRQSVYLHFGSRTGLLLALVEYVDEVEELGPVLAWAFSADNGTELVRRAMEMQAIYTPRIAAVADALEGAARTDPAALAALEDRSASRLAGCRQVVARLAEWGDLTPALDADEAAALLWALISVPIWRHLVVERGWTAEQYGSHLTRLARAALLR